MKGTLNKAPGWLKATSGVATGKDDQSGGEGSPGTPSGPNYQTPAPPPVAQPGGQDKALKRAKAYLAKCDPAVSGQGGHDQLFKVTDKIINGFGLDPDFALSLLKTDYNPKCQPPWSDKELEHKVDEALSKGKQEPIPEKEEYVEKQKAKPEKGGVTRVDFSKIKAREVKWLWPGWLPLGKLSVLDGDPGLGKTTVLLDIAARVTTTGLMPNDKEGATGGVCILSAEDEPEDTLLPRLLAAGADLKRVHCITEVNGRLPELPGDIPEVEKVLMDGQCRFLIIDPLMAYLRMDSCSDQDVRQALHPLAKMAARRNCAVVYLRHLNKGSGTKAIYRGGGSIAIIGAARAGLLIAEDTDDETGKTKVLAHSKHNYAEEQPSLIYNLDYVDEHKVCKVAWKGETKKRADDLLAVPKTVEEKQEAEETKGKVEIAQEWLEDFLADGFKPVKHCHAEAAKVVIAKATLERAARKACGKPKKIDGAWCWELKGNAEE